MSWAFRGQTIQVQPKLSTFIDPGIPARKEKTPYAQTRHRSFKQVMLQCYRIREEPARKKQAEQEYLLGQELRYIQDHAFRDEGNNSSHPSPGEQDADRDSVIKTENGEPIIIQGEVLRDPKIRYVAEVLRRR